MDIRNVDFVINMNIPLIIGSNNEGVNVDTYLDRIGRKGRFCTKEESYIAKLENYCKTKIEELKDMEQLNKLLAEVKAMNNMK